MASADSAEAAEAAEGVAESMLTSYDQVSMLQKNLFITDGGAKIS